MRRFTILVAALGFSLLPTRADLLEFGAFEGFANGQFQGWVIGPRPDDFGVTSLGTVSQSDLGFQNDGSSAAFAFTGAGDYRLYYEKRVEIDPGQKYKIAITAKTGGGPVKILASVLMIPGIEADGTRKPARTVPFEVDCGGEWKTSTFEVTAEPDEMKLGLQITIRNRGGAAETISPCCAGG